MIVVTGASGVVGRPLVEALLAQGAEVRAVARTPLDLPVEVVRTPELAGATALFLHPRAVGDGAFELVRRAADAGVQRIVALSAANVDDDLADQPSRLRGDRNKEAEDAAVGSGLEWVSLRPSSFAVNAISAWGGQIRAGSVVRYFHAGFEESLIHERDLAEVAARALLTDDLVGKRVDLTGPESLSHQRMVEIIGEVLGRPLRFEEVPPEVAAEAMVRNGMPEPFVRALMARYAAHLDKPQHPPTGEVERILGQARSFADWVTHHAPSFT